jgi:hypothetical protein
VCLPCAAVVVLSPEFVRKKFPMQELQTFLERKATAPNSIIIIPVFYQLTVEQCYDLEALYHSEPWPSSPGVPKVEDKGVLKAWAAAVKVLLETTGVKIEEVRVAWNGDSLLLTCAVSARLVLCRCVCVFEMRVSLHVCAQCCPLIVAAWCRPTTTKGCWLGWWRTQWWRTSSP